jgi:hypothetical protein
MLSLNSCERSNACPMMLLMVKVLLFPHTVNMGNPCKIH